jgi:hypothetical protein
MRDDIGDSWMGEEKKFSYPGFREEPGVALGTARILVCDATVNC